MFSLSDHIMWINKMPNNIEIYIYIYIYISTTEFIKTCNRGVHAKYLIAVNYLLGMRIPIKAISALTDRCQLNDLVSMYKVIKIVFSFVCLSNIYIEIDTSL